MALTIGQLIRDRIRIILRDVDEGGVLWLDAELLNWINEFFSVILIDRPEGVSLTFDMPLVSGAKQTIPVGASRLMEAICNVDGVNEGRVVRRIDRTDLDNENLDWMTRPKTSVVFRYAASLTDPRSFYVYPPSLGASAQKLRIVYASPPADLLYANATETTASLAMEFPLPSEFLPLAANYVLHRAFSKLHEKPEMQQKADYYLALYRGMVGANNQSMEQNNAFTRDSEV